LIIGGGPAGHAAARGYLEAGGRGSVTIVTDEDRPPYERPPLSKELLRGEKGPGELLLDPVPGVEILFGTAVSLDIASCCIQLADGRGLEYDGCVLALGAEPVRPPFDGAAAAHVLRTVPQALGLAAATGPDVGVTVVGTGFIGCEAAASLALRGADVTLTGMEHAPQLARLGPEVGERIAEWLVALGVDLRLGVELDAVPDDDVVLLATGVRPRIDLAADAGLRLSGDAIAADVCLRTTGDRVYAAGDACEAVHPIAGRPLRVEHWGTALEQGDVAGRQLAGELDARWDAVPGFWSTIGSQTLKYAAWGDGFDHVRLVDHDDDAWTAWYADADGACVGVLSHNCDEDYERGRQEIAAGAMV
jgi:NADPH-dependent 2,4-dienoyl-CoA reductase/sulfur reductase-like enzyme